MLRQKINAIICSFSSSFLLLSLSLLSLPSYSAPPAITFPIQHFTVEGELPIPKSTVDALLASFADKEYGLADLQAVSKQVESLIRDAGYSFYRVVLPPQSLADGTVHFNVVSFALGDVDIKGSHYYDEVNLFASLPELQFDLSPNTKTLAKQIKVANHHIGKEVSVIFKQSEEADKVSAKIDVIEQKPYNFSLLANNSGSDDSGNARITAAFQHSNLWNKDHSINLSYTTSPNHTNEVQQYGVSYSAPLYHLGGWLSGYYAKTEIDTGQIALGDGTGLDVSGAGEMYGLHYLHFFDKRGNYEHQLDVGIDNRLFDNEAVLSDAFGSSGDISPDVRSTPLTLNYKGNIALPSVYIGHHISWSKNIGLGSLNDDAHYDESRFNAKQDWDLFRYGAFINLDNNGWLYRASLKGQYSDEPLISGEQFGLGGAYSVRGYEEREVSSDVGHSLSVEAFTPQWNNAKLLAFYDYGLSRSHDALAGEKDRWHLASAGIGLRWQWQANLQVSIDLAHTLRKGVSTSDNHNHAHANIVLQY